MRQSWVLGETKGDGEEHNIGTKRKTSDWMMDWAKLDRHPAEKWVR